MPRLEGRLTLLHRASCCALALLGALGALTVLGTGCAAESERPRAPSWLDDTLAPLPATLSEVGLYPDLRELGELDARAVPYEPAYPLWSNGSDKARYLVLPDGESVSVSEGSFDFPVGSALFKTFAFEDEAGHLRYVETRVLVRGEERWSYGAYQFRDDESEADLLDGKLATEATVEAQDGTELTHAIPSTRQCRTCHESAPEPVLGFTPLQLGSSHDGEGRSPLLQLYEQGVLDEALDDPAPLAEDDETAQILGYALGNCTHCHNGFAEGANSSFDLRPEVLLDNTVGVETEDSASGIGTRIVPGDAEASVLYLAFVGRDNGTGIKAMPPLGVQRRDEAAAQRLRAFIERLPAAGAAAPEPAEP